MTESAGSIWSLAKAVVSMIVFARERLSLSLSHSHIPTPSQLETKRSVASPQSAQNKKKVAAREKQNVPALLVLVLGTSLRFCFCLVCLFVGRRHETPPHRPPLTLCALRMFHSLFNSPRRGKDRPTSRRLHPAPTDRSPPPPRLRGRKRKPTEDARLLAFSRFPKTSKSP